MKKLFIIPLIIIGTLATSCSDDDPSTNLFDELDLSAEASLESSYEDVDVIVSAGMETLESGGRLLQDEVLECAIVNHDEINKVVTIDYGDGCEGPGGRTRMGKIIITYNDHRLVPGSFREITFEDFMLDGVAIEGTRRVDNISEDMDSNPTYSVTLTGGKLTFDDGTSATRDVAHTRTWIRATNPINDEAWVEGEASGSRRDGVTYQIEILERIVYKRGCWTSRVFIPVSGVKQITFGENVAMVDYGDGTCDNEVTITINDGEPFVKTISPRGRN